LARETSWLLAEVSVCARSTMFSKCPDVLNWVSDKRRRDEYAPVVIQRWALQQPQLDSQYKHKPKKRRLDIERTSRSIHIRNNTSRVPHGGQTEPITEAKYNIAKTNKQKHNSQHAQEDVDAEDKKAYDKLDGNTTWFACFLQTAPIATEHDSNANFRKVSMLKCHRVSKTYFLSL
jgi:hypothetical protein